MWISFPVCSSFLALRQRFSSSVNCGVQWVIYSYGDVHFIIYNRGDCLFHAHISKERNQDILKQILSL